MQLSDYTVVTLFIIIHYLFYTKRYNEGSSAYFKARTCMILKNNLMQFVTISFSQQTQNICITFIQCWTNVEDVGPALYKCYTNVLCFLC